jgi:phosphoribosylformylglycinamidine (FGAM) synthase-like enzyme
MLSSAQSGSLGGLGAAIALSCILGEEGAKGAKISIEALRWMFDAHHRIDAVLFGECDSFVVVSFAAEHEENISKLCNAKGVPFTVIGEVVPDGFTMTMCVRCGEANAIDVSYADMAEAYGGGIRKAIGSSF